MHNNSTLKKNKQTTKRNSKCIGKQLPPPALSQMLVSLHWHFVSVPWNVPGLQTDIWRIA